MTSTPRPFRIDVADADLADLDERLARTRYTVATPGEGGFDPARLRRLVDHWRDSFDWRAHEARLNSFAQFTVEVQGADLHFVHLPSANSEAKAIVLMHGWPYTFAEMLPLAEAIRDDFHVVVPSLPGFAFSGVADGPVTNPTMGATVHELMTTVLGYERYFTYGEDVGAGVSDWLAASHPESVLGIFATHSAFTPESRREGETAEESAFFEWMAQKWSRASGYGAIQATRPDTLAAGLVDSPAGLAAWIVEKLEEWSEGDAFTDDQLLTTVMLYWITGSIGTSFRSYFDHRGTPDLPVIAVPAGVSVQRGEREYPRAMAERNYADLRFFTHLEHGAHFAASEVPAQLAADIRTFLSRLAP